MAALVVRFDSVETSSLATVGGKALNLGILSAAGFSVPTGFVVTTQAYELAVGDRVARLLVELNTTVDPVAAAERVRASILAAPVPEEVREQVLAAYRKLGPDIAVAVRSSATAEDLAFASFAGQQDTFLNIVGQDAVIDAVRRCWASLWTDRAVDYRARNGIDQGSVRLAVVIQEMVQARTAGVLFTADPVTGTRHHTVIDASPGLGEAVVSGAVNPDRFVVDSTAGEILSRRIGDKRMLIRARTTGGGVERVERSEDEGGPSLTDPQINALTNLGRQVQDHFGSPQDIEWALDESGTVWLTQARPITTLYPVPEEVEELTTRAYMCLSLAQGLTRPITPMGLAAFRLIASSVASAAGHPPADPLRGPAAYRSIGQRLFVDITPVVRNRIGRHAMLTVFGVMEARAAAVIRRLTADPRFAPVPASPLRTLRPVARVVLRVGVPRRILLAALSPSRAYRAIDDVEARLRSDLVVPPDATPEQRLDHVQRQLSGRVFLLMPTVIGYAAAGFLLLGLARRLLGDLAGPGELQSILRGLPHNVTTEMDLELWRLTERIRGDGEAAQAVDARPVAELTGAYHRAELPQTAQRGLAEFLRTYGHRAVAEIDLGMPRWSDDPTHLLGVIKNYLRLTDQDRSPSHQFTEGNEQAEKMVVELVGRARRRGRVRARVVGFGLRRARQLAGLRERPKFMLVLALAAVRQQLGLVGEILADQERIARSDDIFFLDLAEVRQGLAGENLSALVEQRRAAYELELRRRHVPRVLLSDGTEPEAVGAVAAADGALVGSPASAGVVTSRARVVLDPVGAHLEPGEILVAPSTDPGWTPLFLTAGGLVMEMGGSNSHGAVVAREYGIPAVVGVPDATTQITSGQLITVDGAAGSVQMVEPSQHTGPLG
ncbi:MAG TPA: PEP/pyruvate-binding domain-containing protein [Propionibacteriaceae bacterium]|nr:PEP/pyruvate-binding domain-containing protein [Propionibacteriaceae bacterium]